jgi:hypothetical protein
MSMSTVAKTTNSTQLKLKEAQEEIGELREALAKQKAKHTSEPSDLANLSSDADMDSSDKMQIDQFTENQALGAALARKSRDTINVSHDPTKTQAEYIGSSSSDPSEGSSTVLIKLKAKENETRAKSINIGSSSSEPSSEPSDRITTSQSSGPSSQSTSTSDSSLSTPSSSSSLSDDSELSDSTQILVTKLKTVPPEQNNTPTKNSDTTDGLSGQKPADHQPSGRDSGSRRAHVPTSDPSDTAGDLPQAGGLGV